MWIGFFLGILYACLVFRGQGEPPRLNVTCGPFKRGMLILCGLHIHHWILALPLALLFGLFRLWDPCAFCGIMCAQGLTYSDRCDLSVPDEPVEEDPHLEAV